MLAGGKASQPLARDLGIGIDDGRILVDPEYRTELDRIYAIGRLTRPHRSQAIISAGTGAIAALDILSREAGTHVRDWDTPPEHDHDHPGVIPGGDVWPAGTRLATKTWPNKPV